LPLEEVRSPAPRGQRCATDVDRRCKEHRRDRGAKHENEPRHAAAAAAEVAGRDRR